MYNIVLGTLWTLSFSSNVLASWQNYSFRVFKEIPFLLQVVPSAETHIALHPGRAPGEYHLTFHFLGRPEVDEVHNVDTAAHHTLTSEIV